jgi:AcrR family transcriptional regulator
MMEKSDKRKKIIRTALEIIAEQGFHGCPMAMVAERAGVGSGTIYRYFENKDALIAELYQEVEGEIIAVLKEEYSVEKPLKERFLHIGTKLMRFFIGHPLYFRYIEQFHNSPYGVSLCRDRIMGQSGEHDIMKDLFEQGVAQHVLKNFPVHIIFALAFGPMIYLIRDHVLGLIVLDDGLIHRVIEASWDGIKR